MAAKLLVTRVRRRQKRMRTFAVGQGQGWLELEAEAGLRVEWSETSRRETRTSSELHAARVIHHLELGM
jgi:hypothetical protein